MKVRKVYRNGDSIIVRTTKDGYETFNTTAYRELVRHRSEYSIEDIPVHKITEVVRTSYYKSPWQGISKFIYKNQKCTVDRIAIVYDAGYVLKLVYTNNDGTFYRYIKNINSLKHLRLLKLSDVHVIERLTKE